MCMNKGYLQRIPFVRYLREPIQMKTKCISTQQHEYVFKALLTIERKKKKIIKSKNISNT
jgi:hypothetical protein